MTGCSAVCGFYSHSIVLSMNTSLLLVIFVIMIVYVKCFIVIIDWFVVNFIWFVIWMIILNCANLSISIIVYV